MIRFKILVIVFIFLAIGLMSCSSDDNSGIVQETDKDIQEYAKIIGTWRLSQRSLLVGGQEVYIKEYKESAVCNSKQLKINGNYSLEFAYESEDYSENCSSGSTSYRMTFNNSILSWGDFYEGEYDNQDLISLDGKQLKMVQTILIDQHFIENIRYKYKNTDYEFVIGQEVAFIDILLRQ